MRTTRLRTSTRHGGQEFFLGHFYWYQDKLESYFHTSNYSLEFFL
jgi:hypothetical protein